MCDVEREAWVGITRSKPRGKSEFESTIPIGVYALLSVSLRPLRSDQYTCTVFQLSGPQVVIVILKTFNKGLNLPN